MKKRSVLSRASRTLVSGSSAALAEQIAGVGTQIAEVAGSIKSVHGQIVEVAEKMKAPICLGPGRPTARQKGNSDAPLRGLMEEKKGLTGTQPPHSNSSDARQSWWGWFNAIATVTSFP